MFRGPPIGIYKTSAYSTDWTIFSIFSYKVYMLVLFLFGCKYCKGEMLVQLQCHLHIVFCGCIPTEQFLVHTYVYSEANGN